MRDEYRLTPEDETRVWSIATQFMVNGMPDAKEAFAKAAMIYVLGRRNLSEEGFSFSTRGERWSVEWIAGAFVISVSDD